MNVLQSDSAEELRNMINQGLSCNQKIISNEDVIPTDLIYSTPILLASLYFGAINCFNLLLELGANVNNGDLWHRSLAFYFSFVKTPSFFDDKLVKYDFKRIDWRGRLPIHFAAEKGNVALISFLVTRNLNDINSLDGFKMTPLHVACEHGNLEAVQFLLQNGSLYQPDKMGRTPLFFAVSKGKSRIVRHFCNTNPDMLSEKNPESRSLLHIAAISDANEIIEFLSENGLNINETDSYGYTPLHYIAERNGVSSIQSILAITALNPHIPDKSGSTALHVAARYGNIDIVKALIPHIDINALDNFQRTPAHIASMYGKGSILNELIANNCNYLLKDINSKTPYHLASGCFKDAMQQLITRKYNYDKSKGAVKGQCKV